MDYEIDEPLADKLVQIWDRESELLSELTSIDVYEEGVNPRLNEIALEIGDLTSASKQLLAESGPALSQQLLDRKAVQRQRTREAIELVQQLTRQVQDAAKAKLDEMTNANQVRSVAKTYLGK